MSIDFAVGQEVVEKRRWKEHEKFFCTVLELGRRHKVLNPDRMRKSGPFRPLQAVSDVRPTSGTEYGRLMYMMMDALKNDVQQLLGFNVAKPIVTV